MNKAKDKEVKRNNSPSENSKGIASSHDEVKKVNETEKVENGYSATKYKELYGKFYKAVKIIKTYLSPVAGSPWKVIISSDNIMPAYKYCTQPVYFFVKDVSGNCYYHPCYLRQDYTGAKLMAIFTWPYLMKRKFM